MIRFFREQKIVTALLVLSILIILAGLIMVHHTNKKAAEAAIAAEQTARAQATVDTMNTIAGLAEQELQESKADQASQNSIADVKPQASLDHVEALNGRIPDAGSEDWCEVMMVKDADAWTEEEQKIFAKNCL